MKKDVIINVEPFSCECKFNNNGSIIITFYCDMKSDDINRRKIVNVNIHFWLLSQLAKYIHKAIRTRRTHLNAKLQTVKETEDDIRNG